MPWAGASQLPGTVRSVLIKGGIPISKATLASWEHACTVKGYNTDFWGTFAHISWYLGLDANSL